MTEITLSKAESKILTAAGGDGRLTLPASMKPTAQERLVGRLLRDKLIAAEESGHTLTATGYQAVGLKPPRFQASGEAGAPRVANGALMLKLLGREQGASLAELTDATGWLPHTARAALSRIRSAGKPLAKSKRDDGATVYRLLSAEPQPARRVRVRKARPEAVGAAA